MKKLKVSSQLPKRFYVTDGQVCILLGLIAIAIEEHSKDFCCRDFMELVRLHKRLCKHLGNVAPDYDYRGGAVFEIRSGAIKAVFPLIQKRHATLALSNG